MNYALDCTTGKRGFGSLQLGSTLLRIFADSDFPVLENKIKFYLFECVGLSRKKKCKKEKN